MKLVKRHRASFQSFAGLSQARELGARLEQMVCRYEQLVGDVLCDATPATELQSRVRHLERELGLLAIALQDQFLARRDDGESTLYASA